MGAFGDGLVRWWSAGVASKDHSRETAAKVLSRVEWREVAGSYNWLAGESVSLGGVKRAVE